MHGATPPKPPVARREPPFAEQLSQIAEQILAPDGPRSVCVTEPAGGPDGKEGIVYFFAHREDIEQILRDDVTFSLEPYDTALKVAGDVRFILGKRTPEQTQRRLMIDTLIGDLGTAKYEEETAKVEAVARAAAKEFMEELRCRPRGRKRKFNAIREYGYFVPYLTAARYLGIPGPEQLTWLSRAFMVARNLSRPSRWMWLSPEQKRCQTMVVWSHLIMGHIFANFENRDGGMKGAAGLASGQLNRHIEQLISDCRPDFEQTLLAEFLRKRSTFKHIDDPVYRAYVRAIMFELVGSIVVLVGISFGRILDSLLKGRVQWKEFLEHLRKDGGHRLIDEALRVHPTTSHLIRRVEAHANVHGVTLAPGEYACVLMGAAGAAAGPFTTQPQANPLHLNFGLRSGRHPCRGQGWARAILREMFLALGEANLTPLSSQEGVLDFLGLPDLFEMEIWTPRHEGEAPP